MVSPPMRPEVMNCLVPSMRQSSPSRTARVFRAEASDPAPGSVRAKAPMISPAHSRGRKAAFCASVPLRNRAATTGALWTETTVDTPPSAAANSIRARA